MQISFGFELEFLSVGFVFAVPAVRRPSGQGR
jgi:hypothetical protein